MNAAETQYRDALTALQQGRFADAERQFSRFLKGHPDHVGALNLLTIALLNLQRFAEAEPVIARAIALNQSSDVSYYNYGLILKQRGKLKEALEQFDRALALNDKVADTWNNRGAVLNDVGHYGRALADFDRAIALNPKLAAAYLDKGQALAALQRFDEALTANDRAIALEPRLARAYVARGALLASLNRHDEALAAYRQALALDPSRAAARSGIAAKLRELGRLDEALAESREAIGLEPANGELYYDYANVKKVAAGDPLIDAMATLAGEDGATVTDRVFANFALGKAYADIGDHERAFAHWQTGNALKRGQVDYDDARAAAQFRAIEDVFTQALIAAKSGQGDPSSLPIFILGMPRSGTTLVEQILASHPQVHGAGELLLLDRVLHEAPPGVSVRPPEYPRNVAGLDGSALGALGARYASALQQLAPQAARVTDKLPANFFYAGMIHLILPKARIIHTVRDPVDTCLSCYSNLFVNGQDFTYDLRELGRFYARYRNLMAHWRKVLPPDAMLEVAYEDVVGDLEGQARRLLAYCGLPWDDRCLAFDKTARPVQTASASQVRQPIYRQSVGRWRVYEKWLGPLLEELSADPTAVR
ncbi:MAG: sulfotransferase [Pseudolabrys sp.]|nr:sulfotransferase [Pseudolabrys sp.]